MASSRFAYPEPSAGADPAVHRVAAVHLRGRAGPLPARVYWPAPPSPPRTPALLVFFPAGGSTGGGISSADALCRRLSPLAGVVVLSASYRTGPQNPHLAALQDAVTAVEWAADHGTELDADPGRLLIAGVGFGGNLAAAVALHARDHGWPPIARQVLICPGLNVRQESVAGVAPATVITVEHDPLRDDGRRYAARLRQAGVEVDEVRDPDLAHGALDQLGRSPATERMLIDLTDSIRRTAGALSHSRKSRRELLMTTASNPDSTREYTITRVLAAPPERVFQAWTDPAHLTHWFGPRDFTTPVPLISLDVRPGGAWQVAVVSGDGAEHPLGGTYREVAEPGRLVFTTGDPENTTGDPASVATVTFAAVAAGTEMTFHQLGFNTDEAHAEAAKTGWIEFFDRLAEHLA